MVSGNNHQRTKNNVLVSCFFYLLDNLVAGCIFRLTLYSTDECVLQSKVFHLCLHLIVCNVSCMRCSMSHEYECCASLSCCIHAVKSGLFASRICDCLSNGFLVIIDHSCIVSNLTEHWLCDSYRLEFIFIAIDRFCHLIVLSTMHQMGRLYNQILNTILYCTVKSLLHVIDHFIISCLYMVDDDLCCKCSSYRPVRISFCKSILDSLDILCTAVIEGSTKAYNKKFILTDLILVTRIVLGSISCVTSEIIRICILTLYQFFLSICQSIPCFFGCLAVLICCVVSFLYIDLVDQSCYIICCFLICIRSLCGISCLSVLFCSRILCCHCCCSRTHRACHGNCEHQS